MVARIKEKRMERSQDTKSLIKRWLLNLKAIYLMLSKQILRIQRYTL